MWIRGLARRLRWWLVVGAAMIIAGTAVTWFTTRDSTAAVQTTTATVASGTYKNTVSASGTVEAAHEADLDFAVGGTVTSVRVAAGDKVAKGQVLAAVDRGSLRAASTAARSSLTAAQSQLGDDEDADASDTQLAADHASVLSAESDVDAAEENLADGVLRSTIAGTVATVDLSVGDQVSGSSGSSQSASGTGTASSTGSTSSSSTSSSSTSSSSSDSAITVVSTKAYTVDATVASADVKRIKKGLQAEITVTGLDDTVYGTVSSVGLVAETSSSGAAEFPVTIAVTGSPKGLYAGSSADASIVVKQATNVLTVPTQALHTSAGTTYVTKVVDGKHVRTTVVTGTTYGFATEVTKGLKAGDQVVVASFRRPTGTGTSGGTQRGGEGGFGEGGPPSGGQLPSGGFGGFGGGQ